MGRANGATVAMDRRVAQLRGAAGACGLVERGRYALPGALGSKGVALALERDGVAFEVALDRAGWTAVRTRAPGVPVELSVRPEQVGEWVDKVLRMTVDHEVGDRAFDQRFVVEAAPASIARAALGDTVRQALLALPQSDDGPVATIEAGVVEVRWRGPVHGATLGAAVFAAVALRDAALALREDGGMRAELTPFRANLAGLAVDPAQRERARNELARAKVRGVAALATAFVVSAGLIVGVLIDSGVIRLL